MKISMNIASPQTSSSGPKCLGDGRSRSTATSEATKTTSSSDPAGPSPDASRISRVATAGRP